MKAIFYLVTVLILIPKLCFTQSYIKIPIDSNYYWRQLSTCGYHYLIHYVKDTLVAGMTYNKYSQFGPSKGNQPCPASFLRHGYLRQDTLAKRVFILDNNFLEHPLYNFSKTSVGDTMLMYNKSFNTVITVTVAAVSSNLQGQVIGQVIDGPDYSNILLPGIGSIIGGLFGHGQKLNGELSEKLICFARQNPFVFITQGSYSHGSYDTCDFPTGLDNDLGFEFTNLRIFPNPTSQYLNTDIETEAKLEIYTPMGQRVYSTEIENKKTLDLNFLPNGIYFVRVFKGTDQQTFKILKQSTE